MQVLSQQQILERQEEIEQELLDFLNETRSDFGLADIKELIYNEEGQDAITRIIAMFDTGQGAVELQNIMESVIDAWNYLPHKVLGGISPAEKLLKHQQKNK